MALRLQLEVVVVLIGREDQGSLWAAVEDLESLLGCCYA